MQHSRWILLTVAALAAISTFAGPAGATPQFARTYNLSCASCHTLPPMLNARGQNFLQRGYRPKADSDLPIFDTAPLAGWITARQEDQFNRGFGEMFLNRVELISAGPVPIPLLEDKFSYFVEWRAGSLETRTNGTLRDRSGRFEDAFVMWQMTDHLQFTAGQFRSITQVDVSRRLSVSEPAIFSVPLPGDPGSSARVNALRAFAPAGRSPGFSLQYQSITDEAAAANGLFHTAIVPFVGEWSLPITPEARTEASFVSQGPPKGLFLETFYRYELNTIGAHAFIDNDRWLFTMVGNLNYTGSPLTKDIHIQTAVGWDDTERTKLRNRWSVDTLYLPDFFERHSVRTGVGFRAEHVTGPNTFPAYIPYFALSGPNTSYTTLLQVEYRHQENNRAVFIDLSVIF